MTGTLIQGSLKHREWKWQYIHVYTPCLCLQMTCEPRTACIITIIYMFTFHVLQQKLLIAWLRYNKIKWSSFSYLQLSCES